MCETTRFEGNRSPYCKINDGDVHGFSLQGPVYRVVPAPKRIMIPVTVCVW